MISFFLPHPGVYDVLSQPNRSFFHLDHVYNSRGKAVTIPHITVNLSSRYPPVTHKRPKAHQGATKATIYSYAFLKVGVVFSMNGYLLSATPWRLQVSRQPNLSLSHLDLVGYGSWLNSKGRVVLPQLITGYPLVTPWFQSSKSWSRLPKQRFSLSIPWRYLYW